MFRRYALPCVLIMVVSLGSAGLAYAAAKRTRFESVCVFQALIRANRDQPPSKDFLEYTERLAASEVALASRAGVTALAARSQGVDPGALAGRLEVVPSDAIGAYSVTLVDSNAERGTRLAQAICEQYVVRIQQQRLSEATRQVDVIRDRMAGILDQIRRIEAAPPGRRSSADARTIAAYRTALEGNQFILTAILSLPPDEIAVVAPASARPIDPRSLTRNLLIALVGGLLACFLYVLVGEIVAERRPRGSWPGDDVPPALAGARSGGGDGVRQGETRRSP